MSRRDGQAPVYTAACPWALPALTLASCLCTAFSDNPGVLSELCSTLARLAVRNEFCQEVTDLGGLRILVTLLADCSDHQVEPKVFLFPQGSWPLRPRLARLIPLRQG